MKKFNFRKALPAGAAVALLLSMGAAQASVNTSNDAAMIQGNTPSAPVAMAPAAVNPFAADTQTTGTATSRAVTSLVMHENELLSQDIKMWVTANGYKLFWNSKKDYLIYNTITLSGKTDDEVLQSLGNLFFSENYGLVVKKYEKNRVIVIDEM
ncbi:TcpQ domain-containing protein [Lelliottia sp. WAP21]|uniref:TcpQ domain-containing protein n=1 Tax=Lelliottia sp. WAP21 TaxID=2877426 RepID=UPI001E5EF48F|nr:TcpQ domain-containing protein [Lelliottia sp. WAP21]